MNHRTAAGKLTIIASVVLSACTSLSDRTADGLKIEPAYRAGNSMSVEDNYYAQGRVALSNGHYALAVDLFKATTQRDPKHADAHNGLGIAYGQLGRVDESINQFRLAIEHAPQAARLHNNLGVALLRAQKYDEAAVELDRALALDPLNAMARENLGLVAHSRPAPAVATLARGKASAAAEPAPVPAFNYQVVNADENRQTLVEVSPNFYELRTPTAVAAAQPAVVAPVAAARAPDGVATAPIVLSNTPVPVVTAAIDTAKAAPAIRKVAMKDRLLAGLEISNGVGVSRLANRTARQLESSGLVAVRLTDERPFQQASTEIHYREGYLESARKLQSTLPLNAKLIKAANLHPGINVRLVIGRDMVGGQVGNGVAPQKAFGKVGLNDFPQAQPDFFDRRGQAYDDRRRRDLNGEGGEEAAPDTTIVLANV